MKCALTSTICHFFLQFEINFGRKKTIVCFCLFLLLSCFKYYKLIKLQNKHEWGFPHHIFYKFTSNMSYLHAPGKIQLFCVELYLCSFPIWAAGMFKQNDNKKNGENEGRNRLYHAINHKYLIASIYHFFTLDTQKS